MLVSSFCASRLSDATRRMSATELVLRSSVAAAAPSQLAAALQPSIQMVVSSLLEVLLLCSSWQHLEELLKTRVAAAA